MTCTRPASSLVALLALLLAWSGLVAEVRANYPKPSPYPVSWQLDFDYGTPRRIVVETPGTSAPKAYWYLPYTVTNNTDREQMFLPVFELMTADGQIIRSDRNIPAVVFNEIKRRENKPLLEPFPAIAGLLRIGEDQAKDGVAIWEEPADRMGRFSIFVAGLSGETANLKDAQGNVMKDGNGNPVLLRKTLQLNFHVRGDEVYRGEDAVAENEKEWVMR